MRRVPAVTLGLLGLRLAGIGGLVLLLWNPITTILAPGGSPTVLLDASLSMHASGGRWREALDSASAIAGYGMRDTGHGIRRTGNAGVIWRFGLGVEAFDTTPPRDGASRLGPALRAAAAREGPIVIVTDGEIEDRASLPADVLAEARIVLLRREQQADAAVAAVETGRRFAPGDTVALEVTVAKTGRGERGGVSGTVVLRQGSRELARAPVRFVAGAGGARVHLEVPAARLPTGASVLQVALTGVAGDAEPRDDVRRIVVEVTRAPSVVIVAAPPDWEARFLARTLGDIVRAPVRMYVETEPSRWRDATTLAPVASDALGRAARGAELVVARGDPARFGPLVAGARRRWLWPAGGTGDAAVDGDWYVASPAASPLAAALTGIAWDSLPPATSLLPYRPPFPAGSWVALTARLARRSADRPVVLGYDSAGVRSVMFAADGLWRWMFRGGQPAEAYRALLAAVSDWLLETGNGKRETVVPVSPVVPNGVPVVWEWRGGGEPKPVALELAGPGGTRRDTLRFDAQGRAETLVPPGEYRYSTGYGIRDTGYVVVETYSPEWVAGPVTLSSHPGLSGGRRVQHALRERWWLFLLVIAAFTAEWAWRRRVGLP